MKSILGFCVLAAAGLLAGASFGQDAVKPTAAPPATTASAETPAVAPPPARKVRVIPLYNVQQASN